MIVNGVEANIPVNTTHHPARLMNRNFLLLWQGQFISLLGAQVAMIALVFWIKHATGSAAMMGLIQMAASLPAVFLGPVGGTFADRHSRRLILIVSDLLRALSRVLLAVLIFWAPHATEAILIGFLAVLGIEGMTLAFSNPATSAAIPDLVPKDSVIKANSFVQMSVQISVFVGQGLGGTLFLLLGAPLLFLIDGIASLIAGVSKLFVVIPQTIPEKRDQWRAQFSSFKEDIVEGLRYVLHRPGLRELVFISALITFFTVPVIVLLPFYVEDFLNVKADWYGFLIASYSVGSMVGYVGAGLIRLPSKTRGKWMIGLIIMESAGHGLLGLVTDPLAALGLAFLGGAFAGLLIINITTLLQVTTPSEMRGRVFGLLGTISGGLAPIAMGLTGVIADLIGQNIPLIYITCGVLMVVLSSLLLLSRDVHRFLAYETATPGIEEGMAVSDRNVHGTEVVLASEKK